MVCGECQRLEDALANRFVPDEIADGPISAADVEHAACSEMVDCDWVTWVKEDE